MQREIDRIFQKSMGPQGFTYELQATQNGFYPNLNRGGTTYLKVGEVWKYGETTKGFDRYSQSDLTAKGLRMQPIFIGNQVEIKVQEKIMIYGYFFMNGALPPGNRIFR